MFGICYLKTADGIRVWRNDWASDSFVIMAPITFDRVKEVCELLSIPLIDLQGD